MIKRCFWCNRVFEANKCDSVARKLVGGDYQTLMNFCHHPICRKAMQMAIDSPRNEMLVVNGKKIL